MVELPFMVNIGHKGTRILHYITRNITNIYQRNDISFQYHIQKMKTLFGLNQEKIEQRKQQKEYV